MKKCILCFLSATALLRILSRWRLSVGDGWFTDILLFPSLTLPSVFSFFEFSLRRLSRVSSSLYPLTTWAASLCYCHMSECRPPCITAAFDWPGPSRSASRCLIITLFDCWSREVIDWSAHPVWGPGSKVASHMCVSVVAHTGVCVWGGHTCHSNFPPPSLFHIPFYYCEEQKCPNSFNGVIFCRIKRKPRSICSSHDSGDQVFFFQICYCWPPSKNQTVCLLKESSAAWC